MMNSNGRGAMFGIGMAFLLICLAGTLVLIVTEGPTMRQRDALAAGAAAQAIEATAEADRHAVTKEAARHGFEATRYVTWADVSPMLTRQAVLNNDLEAQLHIANRALIAAQTPAAVPAPAVAQLTTSWVPLVAAIFAGAGIACYALYEHGKTQRTCETVTVRTPGDYKDIEIGD